MTTVEFNVSGKLPALGGELPGKEKSSITGGMSKLDEAAVGMFSAFLWVDALLGGMVLMEWLFRQF